MKYVLIYALALLTSVTLSAQTPQEQKTVPPENATPQQQATPKATRPPAAKADLHMYPELEAAQKDLRRAKEHLEKAEAVHNFGGHRKEAITHINKALAEIKEAAKWNEQQQKEKPAVKKEPSPANK